MASEPERPIEKLLREYAEKRRLQEGPPLEMDPATRRRLQSEVSRRFGRPERSRGSFTELLLAFWPRFALGLGAVAVVVLSLFLVLPRRHEGQRLELLAQNERSQSPAPPERAVAPTTPGRTMLPALRNEKDRELAQSTETAKAAAAPAGTEPPPQAATKRLDKLTLKAEPEANNLVASQPVAKAEETRNPSLAGAVGVAPALTEAAPMDRRYGLGGIASSRVARSSPPIPAPGPRTDVANAANQAVTAGVSQEFLLTEKTPVPAPATTALFAAREAAGNAGGITTNMFGAFALAADGNKLRSMQRFVRTDPAGKAKTSFLSRATPANRVLASFEVEQLGQELRITDQDGSTYTGFLLVTEAAPQLGLRRQMPAQATAEKPALQQQVLPGSIPAQSASYSFRVTGTNHSLGQQVIFSGKFIMATNASDSIAATDALSNGTTRLRSAPAGQGALPLLNSRILGKAAVGQHQEIEIQAVPAKP